MSFGDQPTPPNPATTANQQQQYNIGAGTAQQNLNMVDQANPYGSLAYTQNGTNPDGTPKYGANVSLSPQQQQLYDQYTKTQGITGQTAQNLATNMGGMYSQAPNLDFSSTLKQLQGWQQDYVNPIFKQQESNLDSKLRAQGIQLGSDAYANAQNLQARNEGDVNNQFFQQAEPLAYNQAVTSYQLPLQTYETLINGTQPQSPNFVSTPTAQVQPPNYMGAQQNNYNAQVQNYQNQQAGMWGLAKAGLTVGGTMLGGPIGGALGGAIGSGAQGMFGSAPSGMSYGGQQWPMYT